MAFVHYQLSSQLSLYFSVGSVVRLSPQYVSISTVPDTLIHSIVNLGIMPREMTLSAPQNHVAYHNPALDKSTTQ